LVASLPLVGSTSLGLTPPGGLPITLAPSLPAVSVSLAPLPLVGSLAPATSTPVTGLVTCVLSLLSKCS